jgi:propionyl-CoA synthetase
MEDVAMGTYKEFHLRSIEQRDDFWNEQAQLVDWHKVPQSVCDYSRPPFAKWFGGGEINLCHNAVDRHAAKRPDARALIYVSTETNEEKIYSFADLQREVERMAAIYQSLGVTKGDRVLIYMPMIAEATFAILACARIGAIHSVVFGGFASGSLATRIDDAKPKLIVSADAGMRGGKAVPYKHLLDEACKLAEFPPARVLMVDRGLDKGFNRVEGRDVDYAELRAGHLDAIVDQVLAELPRFPVSGWSPRSRPTSCIPPAPLASRKVSSATPEAMPWRSPRQ